MLSIFTYTYRPLVYLLCWNAYSSPLPFFPSVCVFCCSYWVVGVFHILWILTPYQIYDFYIFSFILWATFLLHRLPFCCANDFTFDIGPFVYFILLFPVHWFTFFAKPSGATSFSRRHLTTPHFNSPSSTPDLWCRLDAPSIHTCLHNLQVPSG